MTNSPFRRFVGRVAVGALAVAVPVAMTPPAASAAEAAPTDLFFSEYVEGSSNNKAFEVFNGTGAAVDLAAGGYTVVQYSNGGTTSSLTLPLTGTIAPGDVHVVAYTGTTATPATPAILSRADQTSSTAFYNGDDALVLRKGGAAGSVLDAIGQVGFRPVDTWGTAPTTTQNATLQRKATICTGDINEGDTFDPAKEWNGLAIDTFDGLGAHSVSCESTPPPVDAAPTVTTVSPTSGGTAEIGDNVTVTFSEAVTAPASAFSLSCAGTPVPFAIAGGPTTFTLDPTSALPAAASCTATVTGSAVKDTDAVDPPDTLVADYTWAFSTAAAVDRCALPATKIGAVQGSGDATPIAGQVTTVRGVVVGDYEGASPNLRGFYLQDTGDGDAATSDGVFVFNGGNQDLVSLGDLVTVTGTAGENQGQTQVSTDSTRIAVCGTATVAPVEVALPVASAADLERHEGMLVTYPQDLFVTEHFQLGRFGQVTLSGGDRLDQPTNVVAPGPEALALQAANNLNRIVVDDASQAQNPDPIVFGRGGQPLSATNTLRGGDTIADLTGVMTYTWGGNGSSPNSYRVRPVRALEGQYDFVAANPRPTARTDVGGDVQVGAMNLLNLFNTFSGCTGGVGGASLDCRGAESQVEFDRQIAKTVAAVLEVDADVLGVNEIENDGYGPTSAIADLVDRLNAATAPGTYAFVDVDAETGQTNALGTDAIKVGMIYQPAVVTRIGQTAALNTEAFVNGGDPAPRARPSLAQAFRVNATGGTFVADVNHFKSKGSACSVPDAGDGQGNCNAVRTRSAQELAAWLDTDPTRSGEKDTVILGDLNSYAKEDPIRTLEEAGYTNLVNRFVGDEAYSYVFDGQWGYLDHALGSAGLVSQVTGVTEYHINADEPSVLDYNTNFKTAAQVESLYAPDEFRVSDHDPIIVGLQPNSAATVDAAFDDTSVPCGSGNASLTVDISDRDALDTHTLEVAWGDGSADTLVDPASGTQTLTHTYAAAGRYTATVTVTDSDGHVTTTTATVAVEFTTAGLGSPFKNGEISAKAGSTVPVKVGFSDCDGSVPTDLAPTVTVSLGGTTVLTGTATFVDGQWQYNLRTGQLPDRSGTYTVTVTVRETGQTVTGTVRLRR